MPKLSVFWLSLLLCNVAMLLASIGNMLQLDYYQFIPVIFLAVPLFVYFRWDRQLTWPSSWPALVLLLAGVIASIAALGLGSNRAATLGFLCFAGCWLLTHREQRNGESLISLWPPLWLTFRLPSEMETGLVFGLQQGSSYFASNILDLLNVTHFRQGNIIELTSGKLFVEEACSGVQSVFTLFFCALFLIPLFNRSMALLPLYIGAAALWAMVLNIVRIVSIAYALDRFELDLATGWMHELLGYVCLALSILLLLSTDRLLAVFFFPTPTTNVPFGGTNPINKGWNLLFLKESIGVAGENNSALAPLNSKKRRIWEFPAWASGLLIIFCLSTLTGQLFFFAFSRSAVNSERLVAAWRPQAAIFAGKIPGLEIVAHRQVEGSINMPFGQLSDVWDCRFNQIPIQIAFSQPYPEWHDLRVCYSANAWKLMGSEVIPGNINRDWTAVEAEFLDGKKQYGYVLFSGIDAASAEPIPVPLSGFLATLQRIFEKNVGRRFGVNAEKAAMIQLFVVADGKMTASLEENFRNLHLQLRDILRIEYQQALDDSQKP
jgi:exosortase